jgi:integrase
MPKIPTSLTDTKIRKSRLKEKDYSLSDGKGLQLLIKTDGKKQWQFVYTSPTLHKRRKAGFGAYPDVTLEKARQKRQEYRCYINDDIDPIDYFREKKKNIKNNKSGLFTNVVSEWLLIKQKEVKCNYIKPKTYQRIESLLLNDTVPYFKNINIKDIKHSDITKIIELKNKTAPVSAKRLLQYLNKLWLYAVSKGYCDFNIIMNIDKSAHITRTPVNHYSCITDLNILEELINSIYNYSGHYSTKNALKLVLHIPLRAKNLVTLKWKHINFNEKLLTIPRADMKVSNENLKDFTMPLSDEVVSMLKEQYQFTSSRKYVFATDQAEHLNMESTNRALQRLGFNDDKRGRKQRTHSFRSTFRSLANTYQSQHGVSFEAKERALDHLIGSEVERSYTHGADYMEELKILMTWWSEFIVKMIDKETTK